MKRHSLLSMFIVISAAAAGVCAAPADTVALNGKIYTVNPKPNPGPRPSRLRMENS